MVPGHRPLICRLRGSPGAGLRWQLDEARKGRVSYFAPGTQWLPWIHLDDVAAFVLRALDEERWHGTYNLVAPQQVRSREFAETLARVTGAARTRRSPALAARLFVGSGADIMLGGRRVVPRRLHEAGYDFQHARLEGALRARRSSHERGENAGGCPAGGRSGRIAEWARFPVGFGPAMRRALRG